MKTLKQELAAGFHSSVGEAVRPGVRQFALANYVTDLSFDYSYHDTIRAIDADSLSQEPEFTTASYKVDNREINEAVDVELMTLDDENAFIDAENDARRATIECDSSINEIDRILGTVGVVQSVSGNEKGE